ncbi:DUF2141 domain-containing protein [Sphingomonas antarctica]|uniref:DUF2141 domain-containing protein n=1 Tax=Sphingomonas antarctica TaxID=2040274 RepID=UPI0039EC1A04
MIVKHSLAVMAFALIAAPVAARAECTGPALLVKVAGLKNRTGEVRVRAFGGDPSTYFDKHHVSAAIYKVPPPSGPVDYCLAVKPGVYAVDVRQDLDGDGKTSASDGVGASGNPQLSLFDILFKRRPPAVQVQVRVGQGVTPVSITVRYRG